MTWTDRDGLNLSPPLNPRVRGSSPWRRTRPELVFRPPLGGFAVRVAIAPHNELQSAWPIRSAASVMSSGDAPGHQQRGGGTKSPSICLAPRRSIEIIWLAHVGVRAHVGLAAECAVDVSAGRAGDDGSQRRGSREAISRAPSPRMSPRTHLSESWPASLATQPPGFRQHPKQLHRVGQFGRWAPRPRGQGAQAARAGLSPDSHSLSTQRHGIRDRRLAQAHRAPGPGSRAPGGWSWSLRQR